MTPKEIKKLIKTLRLAGVSYYKDSEIELKLGDEPVKAVAAPIIEPVKELTEEEHKEIKHTLDNIKRTFLGTDQELLDLVFPLPEPEKEIA